PKPTATVVSIASMGSPTPRPASSAPSSTDSSSKPPLSRGRRLIEVLTVSVVGGLVLYLGIRFWSTGPLVGVGFAIMMLPSVVQRWQAPMLGFVPGFTLFAFAANYTLRKYAWYAVALLVPLLHWHLVLMALYAYVLYRATRWPAYVVYPLAMGAEEWLRTWIGLGNFNMYQAGTFLFAWPTLTQAADLVGGLGLTVLYAVPLGFLAELARRRIDGPALTGGPPLVWGAGAALAVLVIVPGYGNWRLSQEPFQSGPRIAIVQPSQEHGVGRTQAVVQFQQSFTAQNVAAGAADLIVWPENSILRPYERSEDYQNVVKWLTSTKKTPLLFGAQSTDERGERPTASSLLVDESGEILGRYDKMFLFPFTERRVFTWLDHVWPQLSVQIRELTRRAWGVAPDGRPGRHASVHTLPVDGQEWKFWTPLCYDSCYSSIGREAVANGARFFINMTSEGWNGWGVLHNQMAVNTLRAVENRVGVARVGNTGISCFILPDGRLEKVLIGELGRRVLDKGVLIGRVKADERWPTFYARIGDLLDPLWPVLWLLATVFGFARRVWVG
ncbi:MAG: apolipoprotein N-acyltransferase, partial [Acidobacteriota bacterium]